MSKIRIVTDSSITIEPELVEKYNITVVPLSVMVDGVIYSDSDLREEGRFLDMMKHSKELPKTSQPPVGLFAETYEKLVKEGAEQIVAIHIMHTLSGTCEASRQGASLSGADVTVIDSGFTDQCLKFQFSSDDHDSLVSLSESFIFLFVFFIFETAIRLSELA